MPEQSSSRRPVRTLILAFSAAALAAAGGCYFPGGPGWSADRFTYESTSWMPQSLSIEDTRTGQIFWTMEIPVGQQLVVNFMEGRGTDDQFTPDMMQWQLMPIGRRFGNLENSTPVPPAGARLLRPTVRSVPELPEDMLATQERPPARRIVPDAPPPGE